MYFPYIRGRQYELLALRELVNKGKMSEHIIPIIEPVKLSSTLIKTIEAFIKEKMKICIICNPEVGSFNTDIKDEEKKSEIARFIDLISDEQIIKGHIMKFDSNLELNYWNEKYGVERSDWFVINKKRDYFSNYLDEFSTEFPKLTFIPNESVYKRRIRNNKVLLEDRFNKCDRNSDYSKNTDEFFSDDHLFYKEDGFVGFSDYSVIGEDYLEGGFAPYAVAIHIIYLDAEDNLRIHHFVSDSNNDIQNPAGKFYEAVKKVNDWAKKNEDAVTESLQVFIDHYNNQTYPGLGSVKKVSLMHHLEVIGSYLNRVM